MGDVNKIGGLHYEMMRRCYNENYVSYKDYGAKGVKVCEEWHDRETFKAWAYANGYVKGMRVLRYDTSGDYCPDNCYIGESQNKTIIKGRNKMLHERAKANKKRKAELGIEKLDETKLYHIWVGMKKRCYSPSNDNYSYYGGRGVKVCDEWLGSDGKYNFIKWALTDGGYEEGLTLDRIDVDGDYSPENCRFTTWEIQAGNKRNTRAFIVDGEYLSKAAFCRLHNISYDRYKRLEGKGFTISQILDELEK